MITLSDELRRVLCAGRLAHLATVNADGSPQVSVVWTGLDGNDIVIGHLMSGRKVANIARDPRVALTMEADDANAVGMTNYLIVYGNARLVEGGAPELLQRSAEVYLGPGVKFPPMESPPPGHDIHICPERISGVGPWTGQATSRDALASSVVAVTGVCIRDQPVNAATATNTHIYGPSRGASATKPCATQVATPPVAR